MTAIGTEGLLGQRLLQGLGDQWGWIALRGICAVIFGLLTLVAPGVTLGILVIVWGVYALVDGIFALIAGVRIRENGKPLWSLIVTGLLGIGAGVVTLLWPGLTALTLILIIGFWAIAIGVFQVVAAIRFRKEIDGEWFQVLAGLLSIIFGGVVVLQPGAGALGLAWLIGGYAIVFGVLLLALAWRVRSAAREGKQAVA
jgi:uncharacterized membrane protein HdeD (DUF308 family)